MRKLDTYLSDNGIRQAEFAERIGVSQSMVSRLANGVVVPSLELAVRIARETGGLISVDCWCAPPECGEAAE